MHNSIPSWAAGYVGLEFLEGGRDRKGVDCWGLVRLVYRERFGILLPSLKGRYRIGEPDSIARLVDESLVPAGELVQGRLAPQAPAWKPLPGADEFRLGDVVLFRLDGRARHVGLVLSQARSPTARFLHSFRGTRSCIERLDSAVWARRLVAGYRYSGSVGVTVKPLPFGGHDRHVALPEGADVASMLRAAQIESSPGLRVFLGGSELPPESWPHVRPKAGRQLVACVAPLGSAAGGGKTPLRIIGTIAIIAAAAWVPGALGFAAGSVSSALAAGAIGIGGAFLLNALAPPPKPRLSAGEDRESPSIQGARNELRPYDPIPVILGTHRVVPPYGAAPYTEVLGDDQYLRCLFVVRGPIEISDLKIGATPLEDFEGVEVEVRNGFEDDDPVRLYPNTVHEETLSVLLDNPTSWVSRTTQTDTDEISVDLTFPTGLAVVENDGTRSTWTVETDVQYRAVGASDWINVNGNAGVVGSPEDARGMDLLFRTPEVELGGTALFSDQLAWGGAASAFGTKPAYLPATGYSWVAEGWLHDAQALLAGTGEYQFAIDCADAGDLEIDGRIVASWYGSHGTAGGGSPDYSVHRSANILLPRGVHRIRIRVECRSDAAGAGAIAIGWRRPVSPGVFTTIGRQSLRSQADNNSTESLAVSWYRTTTYVSTQATSEARTTQVRRTLAWAPIGGRGQYEVRVRRVTFDSTEDRVLDQVYWTALRSITNEDPIRLPGCAKIALRIRATDQLNGVVDQFNFLARSIVNDYVYEFGTWPEGGGGGFRRASNNPAALYRHILQGSANARPVPDERLHICELAEWHDACRLNGWTFNGVLDTKGTVYERLTDVAAAGRASFGMRDGRYSIVRDREQTVPVQHFTPANSFGFRGRKAFPDVPHALRVRFLDETADYQDNERIVYDDGYDQDNATRFEAIELFGVTDPDLVWKHARYHIAVARLRPEVFELGCDVDHLAAARGDLVLVNHDVPLIGEGFGRIVRLIVDAGNNLTGLVLGNEVTLAPGIEYRVRVRLSDGSSFVRGVVTPTLGATTRTITFGHLAAGGDPRPAVGDMYLFGRPGLESREMIVQRIEINPDLTARLTLIDHAPEVHEADQGFIPAYDPGISLPADWRAGVAAPVIESIRSDDWVMVRHADGSLGPRMVIALRRPSGALPVGGLPTLVQVRIRTMPPEPAEATGPWTELPTRTLTNDQVAIEPVEIGVRYQIRLRLLNEIGQASDWTAAEHTVVGNVLPPPDVASFEVSELLDGVRQFAWDLGTIPPDVAGVRIRYAPAGSTTPWAGMTPAHTGVMDAASPQELLEPPSGAWRIAIKMVDTVGNESMNELEISATLGAQRPLSLYLTEDAADSTWAGTKTDCHVSGASLVADSGATLIVYEHTAIDLGSVRVAVPYALVTSSSSITVEFRHSTDGSTWSDWLLYNATFGTGEVVPDAINGQAFNARYHQWRVTAAASPLVPTPAIGGLVMYVDAQPVEHMLNDIDTSALSGSYRLGVGDVRLPIDAGRFTVIRHVTLSFNGTGAGYSYVVTDKSLSPGPRVKIYDETDTLADATVDAIVRGF